MYYETRQMSIKRFETFFQIKLNSCDSNEKNVENRFGKSELRRIQLSTDAMSFISSSQSKLYLTFKVSLFWATQNTPPFFAIVATKFTRSCKSFGAVHLNLTSLTGLSSFLCVTAFCTRIKDNKKS